GGRRRLHRRPPPGLGGTGRERAVRDGRRRIPHSARHPRGAGRRGRALVVAAPAPAGGGAHTAPPLTSARATVRVRMSALAAYRSRLEASLTELAAEERVPGAVCGVLLGGETEVATWGVANVATGTPVKPGTLF